MNNDDEKISSLYRQADTPDPPSELDQVILKASRAALDRPAATKAPFSAGWPAAASIAAVAVITIILVPILKQQEPQMEPTQPTREEGTTAETADESGLKTFSATDLDKKSLDAPSPAHKPALLPGNSRFSEDKAMPVRDSASSRAQTAPEAGADSALETEDLQAETGSSGMARSRMQAADSAPFAIITPEMWEVKISRLITDSRIDDARAEVEKLEQHYPEYTIDPTLLEKLK